MKHPALRSTSMRHRPADAESAFLSRLIARVLTAITILMVLFCGMLGFCIAIGFGGFVMRLLLLFASAARRITNPRLYAIAACAWTVLILLAPLKAGNVGSLARWDPTYPLLIGNETTANRGWQ